MERDQARRLSPSPREGAGRGAGARQKRRLQGQRGIAAVELAIVLIPLALMAFGATEFGRAVYQYNTLAKSVRAAARYLSLHNAGDAAAIAQAVCLAYAGHVSASCSGEAPVVPGLTQGMIEVCDAVNASACSQSHASVASCAGGSCTGVVNLVTVKIPAFPFQSLVTRVAPGWNVLGNISFGEIRATMRQDL